MKFKIDMILDILEKQVEKVYISDSLAQYKKLMPLNNEPLSPETIYIGIGKELNISECIDNVAFILIGAPTKIFNNTIILPTNNDLFYLYSNIIEKINLLQDLELELTKQIYNGTYQEMLEIAFKYLQNPIVFFDISCRCLAIYPPEKLPDDDEWNYVVENGFFSLESTKSMKAYGNFDLMNTFNSPDYFKSSLFPNRAAVANIKIQNINFARIVIPEAFHCCSKLDLFAVSLLSSALHTKMSYDNDFMDIRGENPVYIMFHQLLSGIKLDKSLLEDRLKDLPAWNKGYFRILYIPLGINAEQIYYFFANSLKKIGYTILFENNSVTFIHYLNDKDFDTIKKLLKKFIEEADLIGCISNEFTSLSDTCSFFKQAKVIYPYVNKSKNIYYYHDYVLNHLFSFYENENKPLLSHPALNTLKIYDSQNNTLFYSTLRVYLENERSLVKTAKTLYIHRNTLLYRIDKIQSILNLDLDDSDIRLYLLMSYHLLEC